TCIGRRMRPRHDTARARPQLVEKLVKSNGYRVVPGSADACCQLAVTVDVTCGSRSEREPPARGLGRPVSMHRPDGPVRTSPARITGSTVSSSKRPITEDAMWFQSDD